MEGLGTTVDCVLVNGMLKEGDRIVVCGLGGPLVTRIKALKTPQVLREMRVKGALMDHKEIYAAMGVRVVAPGLETAVAGTSMYVIGKEDDEEELKDAVMEDMADIFSKVGAWAAGRQCTRACVCVRVRGAAGGVGRDIAGLAWAEQANREGGWKLQRLVPTRWDGMGC